MSNDFAVKEFRALTPEEFRLLEWLLAHGTAEGANYAAQLSRVRVVARCTCGCPTLDLALDAKESRTVGFSMILAEAGGRSPEGVSVNLMLARPRRRAFRTRSHIGRREKSIQPARA